VNARSTGFDVSSGRAARALPRASVITPSGPHATLGPLRTGPHPAGPSRRHRLAHCRSGSIFGPQQPSQPTPRASAAPAAGAAFSILRRPPPPAAAASASASVSLSASPTAPLPRAACRLLLLARLGSWCRLACLLLQLLPAARQRARAHTSGCRAARRRWLAAQPAHLSLRPPVTRPTSAVPSRVQQALGIGAHHAGGAVHHLGRPLDRRDELLAGLAHPGQRPAQGLQTAQRAEK